MNRQIILLMSLGCITVPNKALEPQVRQYSENFSLRAPCKEGGKESHGGNLKIARSANRALRIQSLDKIFTRDLKPQLKKFFRWVGKHRLSPKISNELIRPFESFMIGHYETKIDSLQFDLKLDGPCTSSENLPLFRSGEPVCVSLSELEKIDPSELKILSIGISGLLAYSGIEASSALEVGYRDSLKGYLPVLNKSELYEVASLSNLNSEIKMNSFSEVSFSLEFFSREKLKFSEINLSVYDEFYEALLPIFNGRPNDDRNVSKTEVFTLPKIPAEMGSLLNIVLSLSHPSLGRERHHLSGGLMLSQPQVNDLSFPFDFKASGSFDWTAVLHLIRID